jgi:hypothetical protein
MSLAFPRRLLRLAVALIACAGVALALRAAVRGDQAPALGRYANESSLDFAVDTSQGGWCTEPQDGGTLRAIRTIEGWLRLKDRRPGILLDLGSSAGNGPRLRVSVTAQAEAIVEFHGRPVQSRPLPITLDAWTHFHVDLAGEPRLSLWDDRGGPRMAATDALNMPVGLTEHGRLCVGAGVKGERPLPAWIDDVRLWSTSVPPGIAASWRDRRVSPAHPYWNELLASWSFSAGGGGTETGEGGMGPLTAADPKWVALPRLAYGPVLRSVDAHRARFLFGARAADGADGRWVARVDIRKAEDTRPLPAPAGLEVDGATDFVAHLALEGLEPQTRYVYVPLIDGRAGAAGPPESLPAFTTMPALGGRNADFTAAFFADQHTADVPQTPPLPAYQAAGADRPLFWGQLGDVIPGSTDGRTIEHKRDREVLRALWERNFGAWDSPQGRFLRTVPLGLTTISDHEITNNYDLNWHHHDYADAGSRGSSTLRHRIRQYDLSLARWWNYFGWGAEREDPLARAAREDFGRSAMGEVYATPGLYHALRPYPFVEFFVLDTTSYRGDTYQFRDRYARTANRDRDHARYAWNAESGPFFIFGDRTHGGNETTDRVRGWLGPAQKAAFLAALRATRAGVVVVAAGYPLYSYKFEDDPKYWEGRESGFDFALEAEEIAAALQGLDRLVLWVHGDGHTPALVRLRKNLYQLQVGPTILATGGTGHRARTLGSGSRSHSDLIGGGHLLATHQPDLSPGDPANDVFRGGLDKFEGYLRLYFHPGQEALRSVERAGLRRGADAHAVEVAGAEDPAVNQAGRLVVGRVARLRFGDEVVHAVIEAYRHEAGRAIFRLESPVVRADPDEFRIIVDAVPWVETRWYDAGGREWRDLSNVLRREP